MNRDRSAKSIFVIELSTLFILLIVLITVITGVLVTCRNRSEKAVLLNEAVILATSFAETAAVSPAPDDLQDAVSAMDNTRDQRISCETDIANGICALRTEAVLDPEDDSARRYLVKLTRTYRSGTTDKCITAGDYASDIIEVFAADGNDTPGEPLYSLQTGTYFRGEAGS